MSNMLSKLMDRYPIILWIGAGILGKVGGQMMITDPWIQGLFPAPAWMVYGIEAIGIAFVCGLAKFLLWKRQSAGSLFAAPAASQPEA
jgi:predicted tellurium resistance membrane protein TerC